MDLLDPKFTPKLARNIAKWTREKGPLMMATAAVAGTWYHAPPGVPPLVRQVGAYRVNTDTGETLQLPTDATIDSHRMLANYYAETLETAKCFHLRDKMANLALRTQMGEFKLTADMLKIGPGGSFVPRGFITWGLPIGQAENTGLVTSAIDFRSGEMSEPKLKRFSPYADADFPVVAAAWRYEPEANSVWVVFYAEPTDHLRIFGSKDMSPAQVAELKKVMQPLTLEREQELPLDKALNWCDAEEEPRLKVTAGRDPESYPEHLRERAVANSEAAKVFVSDWVRVLVSSWLIMKWKVAHREVLPPPQDVIRKVSKETKRPKEEVAKENGTIVVTLGGPLQQRRAKSGSREYSWKTRALVGPVVRTRQYIPAWDTYDEEPRFIEPFWMGPPDAPISNTDRVFVLDE